MLQEYLDLWYRMERVQLHHDEVDSVRWAWEPSGSFATRSAYQAEFWARENDPTVQFTWKSKAPLRCKFFTWLAMQNRCWTSNRLASRGLEHEEACPFCDQVEESMNHLMLRCVFAREVWTRVCTAWGKPQWTPTAATSLAEWCVITSDSAVEKKDTRALIVLVLWEL